MRRATVVELERTCGAYPSQWEGALDDGRHVYVRWRGGHGCIGIGATLDEAVDATIDGQAYRWSDADIDPGRMSDDAMLVVLRRYLNVEPGVLAHA